MRKRNLIKLVLMLLVIGASSHLAQTGELSGTIKDAVTDDPVLGASLNLEGTQLGAASIEKGEYIVTKIPPGKYSLRVSKFGYKDLLVKDVSIKAGEKTELDLLLKSEWDASVPRVAESMYLKALKPDLVKELDEIKEINKHKYNELLNKVYWKNFPGTPFFEELDENEKERLELSKEIVELEIRSEALGIKYREVAESEKAKIKKDLRQTLLKLFEAREKEREIDVAMLEKELKELQHSLQKRKTYKDEIVKRRLEELIGENKYLEWD